MYTKPSYNEHILHGDALYNLKKERIIKLFVQKCHCPNTTEWLILFYGICNFCFICNVARLSQYSKIALSKICTHTVYIVTSEHYIYYISSSGVPFLYCQIK